MANTPAKSTKAPEVARTTATPSRRQGLHQPRARSFRYSESSKPMSRAPKDDYTLNRRGPQVEILRPKWNGATPTTIRPFPMFCPEDPNGPFEATRLSCDEFDFSDWTRGLPAAKYVGVDQKFTFITHDPRRAISEGYNPRKQNPYHVLYNAIMAAVKQGEAIVGGRDVITAKWAPLTVDGPKKAFQAPTKLFFYQGLVYEHDGETYVKGGGMPRGLDPETPPIIIEVSKTAGEQLAKKLNKLNPAYVGDTDPDCQSDMYLYGDIVNLKNGSFITFFNPEKHECEELGAGDVGGEAEGEFVDEAPRGASDGDRDGDDRAFKGWETAINREFHYAAKARKTGRKTADISEYEDAIRSRLVWWDDVLYIPNEEEIAFWLAQAFRSMPDLLRFGWADNAEFFTDEVRGVLANRTIGRGAEVPTDDVAEAPETTARSSRTSRAVVDAPVVEDDQPDDAATLAAYADDEYDNDEAVAPVAEDANMVDEHPDNDEDAGETDEEAALERAMALAMERAKNRRAGAAAPAQPAAGTRKPAPAKTS